MELTPYVDHLRRELAVAAEAGGEDARALAERLTAPLESAVRLTLLDALSAAASEITRELAPGSVDLRLRGREPSFVVTPPPAEQPFEAPIGSPEPAVRQFAARDEDEGGTSRINLRLPDRLKGRIEEVAGREGVSVNAWLVRAAATALETGGPGAHTAGRAPRGRQHYTGWAR